MNNTIDRKRFAKVNEKHRLTQHLKELIGRHPNKAVRLNDAISRIEKEDDIEKCRFIHDAITRDLHF